MALILLVHFLRLTAGHSYIITIISASGLYLILYRENKAREALDLDPTEAERLGFKDLTDKENLHFRYAL